MSVSGGVPSAESVVAPAFGLVTLYWMYVSTVPLYPFTPCWNVTVTGSAARAASVAASTAPITISEVIVRRMIFAPLFALGGVDSVARAKRSPTACSPIQPPRCVLLPATTLPPDARAPDATVPVCSPRRDVNISRSSCCALRRPECRAARRQMHYPNARRDMGLK